jgi:hypothetical protein
MTEEPRLVYEALIPDNVVEAFLPGVLDYLRS